MSFYWIAFFARRIRREKKEDKTFFKAPTVSYIDGKPYLVRLPIGGNGDFQEIKNISRRLGVKNKRSVEWDRIADLSCDDDPIFTGIRFALGVRILRTTPYRMFTMSSAAADPLAFILAFPRSTTTLSLAGGLSWYP